MCERRKKGEQQQKNGVGKKSNFLSRTREGTRCYTTNGEQIDKDKDNLEKYHTFLSMLAKFLP